MVASLFYVVNFFFTFFYTTSLYTTSLLAQGGEEVVAHYERWLITSTHEAERVFAE